jgi:hypothetical protein
LGWCMMLVGSQFVNIEQLPPHSSQRLAWSHGKWHNGFGMIDLRQSRDLRQPRHRRLPCQVLDRNFPELDFPPACRASVCSCNANEMEQSIVIMK